MCTKFYAQIKFYQCTRQKGHIQWKKDHLIDGKYGIFCLESKVWLQIQFEYNLGVEMALIKHQICERKFENLNPSRVGLLIFFYRVDFLCWLWFSNHSIPVLPQWHIGDANHFAKSAGGRFHLNMHTPFIQRTLSELTMLSMHSVATYQEHKLTLSSSGNVQPQSSQLAEALWTNRGLKSWIGVHFVRVLAVPVTSNVGVHVQLGVVYVTALSVKIWKV